MLIRVLRYLAIRFGILIIVLTIIVGLMYLLHDPHSRCDAENHRHTMGIGMGMFVVAVMVTSVWSFVLFMEGFVYFTKKNNTIGFGTLLILLILIITAMAFLYL